MKDEAETYCACADQHFVVRAAALYESLCQHNPGARLWLLCLDEEAYDRLQPQIPQGVTLVRMCDFEQGDSDLAAARQNRSWVEYVFTCKPAWMQWLLSRHHEISRLTYLDADLCFYADPAPLYQEMGDASVALTGHRFSPRNIHLRDRGLYNAGWVCIRNDGTGRAALDWWRKRCLEWCHNRVEAGKFTDQAYLDDLCQNFPNVVELKNAGANVGPWNLETSQLSLRDGRPQIGGVPLIFFHFHGLRHACRWVIQPNLSFYGAKISHAFREGVLIPYLHALDRGARHFKLDTAGPLVPGLRSTGDVARGLIGRGRALAGILSGLFRRTVMIYRSNHGRPVQESASGP